MKSIQGFACALILVCAVVTQVESAKCSQIITDAVKTMRTNCVSEDVDMDNMTENEEATILECLMQESEKHHAFDDINAKCNSDMEFKDKLMCFHIQLGEASCGPTDLQ